MSSVSSFSSQLVDSWANQFKETSSIAFRVNAATALNDFKDFQKSYEDKIPAKFPPPAQATEAEKKLREVWLTEQINLALDVFWEPLARMAEQLKSEPYKEFFSNTHPLINFLDQFYANVQKLFGDSSSQLVEKILIYFNKAATINRYPYTQVALIGIPYRVFTQASNERGAKDRKTWMAIAHELGHHIYWNMAGYGDLAGQIKKFEDGILEKLKTTDQPPSEDIKNLIRPWIGEIFADAVGLQISGKDNTEKQAFIDTCKELIRRKTDNEKSNLALDDGDHVPDGLRLLVPLASLYWAFIESSDPKVQWEDSFDDQVRKPWKDFMLDMVGQNVNELKLNFDKIDTSGSISQIPIKALEVADHICNTVKIILDEIAKFKALKEGDVSLFTISSSPEGLLKTPSGQEIVDELINAATTAAKTAATEPGKADSNSILSFALDPEVLEGEQGENQHTHKWKTTNPHSHSRTSSNHNF